MGARGTAVALAGLLASAGCSAGSSGSTATSSANTFGSTGSVSASDSLTTGISAANVSNVSNSGGSGTAQTATVGSGGTAGGGCSADAQCPEVDGDPCTVPTCGNGQCSEVDNPCDPPENACAQGTCDPGTGACSYTPMDEQCPQVMCNPATCSIDTDTNGAFLRSTCTVQPADQGDCDDADPCTDPDTCQGGQCVGQPIDCSVAPDPACNGATLEIEVSPGTCQAGSCTFDTNDIACPLGCDSGLAQCNPPDHPVISELLYDDPGTDDNVWIEIWAPPGSSLAGITVESINGNGGAVVASFVLSGTTPSDGLILIVDPVATDAALIAAADFMDGVANLQNGPDSVRLSDTNGVIDAVGYGTFSSSDVFDGEGSPAPDASNTDSLARIQTWVDSDDNSQDFVIDSTPTPGALND